MTGHQSGAALSRRNLESFDVTADSIQKFCAAMDEHGLQPPVLLDVNGGFHRFHIYGDEPGSKNGWYQLDAVRRHVGQFGCLATNRTIRWINSEYRRPWRAPRHVERMQEELWTDEMERWGEYEKIALQVADRWARANAADPRHPYLVSKAVGPANSRQDGNRLLAPMVGFDGKIWNLVELNGKCLVSQSRGRFYETFSPIGHWTFPRRLLICTDWPSGAALHEKTGIPVLCTIDCANMEMVSLLARDRWPEIRITLCGGSPLTENGRRAIGHAEYVAGLIDADFIVPMFRAGESGETFGDIWRNRRGRS